MASCYRHCSYSYNEVKPMATTRIIQTDQFQVKGSSGKVYTITEETTQHDGTTISDTHTQWKNGLAGYTVQGGGAANKSASGEFVIVATGESCVRI